MIGKRPLMAAPQSLLPILQRRQLGQGRLHNSYVWQNIVPCQSTFHLVGLLWKERVFVKLYRICVGVPGYRIDEAVVSRRPTEQSTCFVVRQAQLGPDGKARGEASRRGTCPVVLIDKSA